MKVYITTILFALLAYCYGYSYIIPASMKHPGICFFNGHILQKGDNQMPTTCQNMHCNEDGSILVQGCGRLDLQGCTLLEPVNLDKQYPDCCEMAYRCKNADGNVVIKKFNQLKSNGGAESGNMETDEKVEQIDGENNSEQEDNDEVNLKKEEIK